MATWNSNYEFWFDVRRFVCVWGGGSFIGVMDIEIVFNIVYTVDVTLATDDEAKNEPDDI